MRQGVPFVFELKVTKAFKVLKAVVAEEQILKKWWLELPTKVKTDIFNSITSDVLF